MVTVLYGERPSLGLHCLKLYTLFGEAINHTLSWGMSPYRPLRKCLSCEQPLFWGFRHKQWSRESKWRSHEGIGTVEGGEHRSLVHSLAACFHGSAACVQDPRREPACRLRSAPRDTPPLGPTPKSSERKKEKNQYFHLHCLVSSVQRAPDWRVGGHGFESQLDSDICKWLDLQVAH